MILRGRVAIVTGGSQGVGQGIANVLAREGARVVICNRHREQGQAAADAIKARGWEAGAFQADVMKMAEVKAMVAMTLGLSARCRWTTAWPPAPPPGR